MDDHEFVGEIGEHASRRRPAADARRGCGPRWRAIGRERAPRVRRRRLDVAAGVANAVGDGPVLGHDPHAVDRRLCGSRADGSGVSALTEQQAEPGDDHRLARTGLARDGGEAGADRQRGLGDDAEIAQAHLLDHGLLDARS